MLVGLGFAVVLPVVALIVGTGVLGAEIDDGTIVHILTKPLPRWRIVLPKLLVAAGGHRASPWPSRCTSSGCWRRAYGWVWRWWRRSAVGALAYSAIFLALSLVTRRPVLLGLVYVLIWEGLLGNIVSAAPSRCRSSSTS